MELYGLKKLSSSCNDLREACPYTLEQIIQKGNNSVRVIKAFSPESNETVAVKLFPKSQSNECQPNFLNEEQALKTLSHPHIVSCHDTYSDAVIEAEPGRFVEYSAIIMEFGAYGDLFGLVSQKNFSEKLARSLFRQIIAVTQYLHNQDYIHLDLKLENFLITPKEGIKLIDFEACHKITKEDHVRARGTPGYRAPEIVKEEFQDLKALDIYSLGVILFMMVSGTPPYVEVQENGKWKYDRYYEALRRDPKVFWSAHEKFRTRDGKEAFSQEFKDIVEAMLDVNPSKRPKIEVLRRSRWVQGEVFNKQELEHELLRYFEADA